MSNAGLTEAECREIAEETALQKHAADLKAEHMRATMIYDDGSAGANRTAHQARILQQRWYNGRVSEWRDVEEVEEADG